MDIIQALESAGHKLVKKTANELATQCPGCGGVDRFCVFIETNRYWCRQCDEKGDLIDYFRRFQGMTFPQAARAAGQEDKLKKNPGTQNNVTRLKPKKTESKPPKEQQQPKKKKIVATYDYVGTDYTLIYQAVRFEPKGFAQRRPAKAPGQEWAYTMGDTPRVIYRLPDVLEEEVIFFVEGEKDADRLWSLGQPATTTPQGTASIDMIQEKYKALDALDGKIVWIFPDNDPPGKEYANKVAGYLDGKAKEIKIVELPVDLGGDISDFLDDSKGDMRKLRKYIDQAPIWTPDRCYLDMCDILNKEFEKTPPIISDGILYQGTGLLIAGEGGVGKSLLRTEIALHLALGWDWLDFKIPSSKKVFVMQYENSERTEQARVKYMMQGMGAKVLPKGLIRVLDLKKKNNWLDLTRKGDVERLFDIIDEAEPEVIIYDCLSNLHSSKENDNVQMRNIVDVFSKINAHFKTSCILIHHFGKPPQDAGSSGRYRVRGASSITDWADCVLTYIRKPHEHKDLRLLENTKMRNAKELKTMLLERNEYFLTRIIEEDKICSSETVVTVLEILGGTVFNQKDLVSGLVNETGCGDRTARNAIKDAQTRKMITIETVGRQKIIKIN